jgi:hypothetical protein
MRNEEIYFKTNCLCNFVFNRHAKCGYLYLACGLGANSMTKQTKKQKALNETIEILTQHNKWRRGGYGVMTNPAELGRAIDNAVRELKKIQEALL